MSWVLTECGPGDGGFGCVPGSHKSNYPMPDDVALLETDLGIVKQVEAKAGSVIIFTEALAHGTMPWTAERQRRSILYKYSPGPMSYARDHIPEGVRDILDEFTPEQRAGPRATVHPRAPDHPITPSFLPKAKVGRQTKPAQHRHSGEKPAPAKAVGRNPVTKKRKQMANQEEPSE